jgi:hypothetical protein
MRAPRAGGRARHHGKPLISACCREDVGQGGPQPRAVVDTTYSDFKGPGQTEVVPNVQVRAGTHPTVCLARSLARYSAGPIGLATVQRIVLILQYIQRHWLSPSAHASSPSCRSSVGIL